MSFSLSAGDADFEDDDFSQDSSQQGERKKNKRKKRGKKKGIERSATSGDSDSQVLSSEQRTFTCAYNCSFVPIEEEMHFIFFFAPQKA